MKSLEILKSEFINENSSMLFCHAATIVEVDDTLISSWFAGSHEGHRDTGVWLSKNDGSGWSPAVKVAAGKFEETDVACWNPVLFYPREGLLMLFFKAGIMPSLWQGMLMTSQDRGLTWSEARSLPAGFLGPVKNKPVQLPDGTIICGSSNEHNRWSVHIEFTSDLGNTWRKTSPLHSESISLIQPAVLRYPSGKLQILCRSADEYIFESRSTDNGKTWSRPKSIELPNPNSGIDALTLADGRVFLVYNHSKQERYPLNIAISDDGQKWQQAMSLEEEPVDRGYSYPSVIQAKDGKVHIVYSWKCQKIKHVVANFILTAKGGK